MPTPINRESLDVVNSLEERYKSQTAGGAYNAKDITTTFDTLRVRSWTGLSERMWSKAGFRVKQSQGHSDFLDVPDRVNSTSKGSSNYVRGHSTKKYRP